MDNLFKAFGNAWAYVESGQSTGLVVTIAVSILATLLLVINDTIRTAIADFVKKASSIIWRDHRVLGAAVVLGFILWAYGRPGPFRGWVVVAGIVVIAGYALMHWLWDGQAKYWQLNRLPSPLNEILVKDVVAVVAIVPLLVWFVVGTVLYRAISIVYVLDPWVAVSAIPPEESNKQKLVRTLVTGVSRFTDRNWPKDLLNTMPEYSGTEEDKVRTRDFGWNSGDVKEAVGGLEEADLVRYATALEISQDNVVFTLAASSFVRAGEDFEDLGAALMLDQVPIEFAQTVAVIAGFEVVRQLAGDLSTKPREGVAVIRLEELQKAVVREFYKLAAQSFQSDARTFEARVKALQNEGESVPTVEMQTEPGTELGALLALRNCESYTCMDELLGAIRNKISVGAAATNEIKRPKLNTLLNVYSRG